VATVQATAMVMDQAKLEFKMTLDPFSYRPTFHWCCDCSPGRGQNQRSCSRYGKFDFKRGWFDLWWSRFQGRSDQRLCKTTVS